MHNNILHLIFKCTATLLLLVVLLPSAIKFAHIFENHKHEVCNNPTDTHFHEVDIDCEFYKFKLNTVFSFKALNSEIFTFKDHYKIIDSQYQFVSDFQRLPFALRGPPYLI